MSDKNAPPRTGVLLLAHAPLASAFARVADDLGVAHAALRLLDMPPNMTREAAFATARMLAADMPCPGCLVLVDMGGGASPFVVACGLQDELGPGLRVVAGLNTAMLITALGQAHLHVDALAAYVARRAVDGVNVYPPSERAGSLPR